MGANRGLGRLKRETQVALSAVLSELGALVICFLRPFQDLNTQCSSHTGLLVIPRVPCYLSLSHSSHPRPPWSSCCHPSDLELEAGGCSPTKRLRAAAPRPAPPVNP